MEVIRKNIRAGYKVNIWLVTGREREEEMSN